MSDSSDLCLSCGLCCDGTLIGFVQLANDELPAIREIMEIEEANDMGFILHPCKKYCDGCTVYEDRPKQCAKFKCGLLTSFEEKEVDFDSAAEAISAVKNKKEVIEMKLASLNIELKSGSFYFKMVELKKWMQKNESSLTQLHRDLKLEIEHLDDLLETRFGVTLD